MSYQLTYSKEAIAELHNAVTWYTSKELELGQKFKNAFNKIRIQLKENPEIFKQVATNHRRAVLGSSFPYTIDYLVNKKTQTVKIIGVFHQHKNIELRREHIELRKIHKIKQRSVQRLNQIHRKNKLEQSKDSDLGMER